MIDHSMVMFAEYVISAALVLMLQKVIVLLQTLTINCCELEFLASLFLHFVKFTTKTFAMVRWVDKELINGPDM